MTVTQNILKDTEKRFSDYLDRVISKYEDLLDKKDLEIKNCGLRPVRDENLVLQNVLTESEINHLQWLHSRLVNINKIQANENFMIRFKHIITKLQNELSNPHKLK